MFTGIVEGKGTLREAHTSVKGARVVIEADFDLDDVRIGDSIAIDGVCLTVTARRDSHFEAEISHETLARTTLNNPRPGRVMNLERALRVGDRLGGHIVQGHVDGVGQVSAIQPAGDATDYHFSAPAELMDYLVEKGSITVDGISLTVNGVSDTGFHVTIIPHTSQVTTLGDRKPGDPVNLETDVVGKYIVSLARRGRLEEEQTDRTLRTLKENGFL